MVIRLLIRIAISFQQDGIDTLSRQGLENKVPTGPQLRGMKKFGKGGMGDGWIWRLDGRFADLSIQEKLQENIWEMSDFRQSPRDLQYREDSYKAEGTI